MNLLGPKFGQDLADALFSAALPAVILGTWLVDAVVWSIQNSFIQVSDVLAHVTRRLSSVKTLD